VFGANAIVGFVAIPSSTDSVKADVAKARPVLAPDWSRNRRLEIRRDNYSICQACARRLCRCDVSVKSCNLEIGIVPCMLDRNVARRLDTRSRSCTSGDCAKAKDGD
jgi:hypothetical protein